MAYPFDVATFNLINFSQKMPDLTDSTPKTVELPVMNEDGSITTRQVQNLGMMKSSLQDILESAADSNTYKFYVDQASGADTNPGTSDAPFKTIEKAISMFKPYTNINLNIIGDYTVDTGGVHKYYDLKNVSVSLNLYGTFKVPYIVVNDKNILSAQFNLHQSTLSIGLRDTNNSKLLIGTEGDDNSLTYDGGYFAGFVISNTPAFNIFSINVINNTDNNTMLELGTSAGLFFNSADSAVTLTFCCAVTGSESIIGDNAWLIKNSRKLFLTVAYNNLDWKDTSGNALTLKDIIIGLTTDANGVPLNYMVTPTNALD